MGALPNATFVGFTGTPIDKTAYGRGTFKTFGADDPKGYLDKYSIKESIEDGTTVPLHYALAPNELLADREAMEREFWSLAELEGVSDVEELNRVLDRAVTLKNMLKNPERVDKVAAFVAKHFRETVEPMGFKAFLVAVDRQACCLYKEALDGYLPADYSKVVISPGHNGPPLLARYHLSEPEERAVRDAFRKPDELPKILIVTEKLLTGFDAPILYCMYLDKPMRDHVLLQAIARVNRPYEDEEGRRKSAGFILDFVGVFDKLERALAFDSEDVEGVIEGLEVLQERFTTLMNQGRSVYLPLSAGKAGDKAAEAVLEHFRDRERREEFYRYFRELEELFEILSPDPFLRPFLEDYEALAEMYRLTRSAYEPHVPVDKSFLRKTAEIVQKHTRTGEILMPEEIHKIDVEMLERLAGEEQSETVKVFNLIKALYRLVQQERHQAPYLVSIGERAEQIARAFEERQLTAQEALRQLEELVEDYKAAERDRRESDLSPEGFAVLWLLKKEEITNAEIIAREIATSFERFPHWQRSERQERDLRKSIYKALIDSEIEVERVAEWADRLLTMLRRAAP
jgi:type I restriction enzyme R subunit